MSKRLFSRPLFTAILVPASAILLGIDFLTKWLATRELSGGKIHSWLWNSVVLVYAQNDGAFLSLGSGLAWLPRLVILIALPLLLLVGVTLFVYIKRTRGWLELSILSLLIPGGIGNLSERIAFGKVTDFMNFGIGSLRTGILNFADLYVTAMSILLFVAIISESRAERAAAIQAEGSESEAAGSGDQEGKQD